MPTSGNDRAMLNFVVHAAETLAAKSRLHRDCPASSCASSLTKVRNKGHAASRCQPNQG